MKKLPLYLLASAMLAFTWGAFLLPSSASAASPYTTNFQTYSGWQQFGGGIPVSFIATSTSCLVDSCVYYGGSGSQASEWHSGSATAAGGMRLWGKGVMSGGSLSGFTCILSRNGRTASEPGIGQGNGPADICPPTGFPIDGAWHSLDIVFEPTATTTRFKYGYDAVSENDMSDWQYLATTSDILVFDKIALVRQGNSQNYMYFDELSSEFALQQFSYVDLENLPYGLSASTTQAFCNSRFSTSSSGILDSIGSSITYGMCSVFSFLFVPNSTVLNQFSGLSDTAQTKIPFSYFYGIKNTFDVLQASSTSNFQSFSIDFPAFGSSTPLGVIVPTHFDIISTTTIDKYYPSGIRTSFNFLASMAIWFGLALSLYHRLVPHKVTI